MSEEITQNPAVEEKPHVVGIFPKLSYDQYAAIDGINFSRLRWLRDTPAHCHHRLLNPPAQSAYHRLGQLVHMAILEPQRFNAAALEIPKLDKRTKEGKAEWARLQAVADQGDKELVTPDEMKVCVGAAVSVSNNLTAREILRGRGAAELSVVWHDEEYETFCKGRLDFVGELNGHPIILDVKTTSDTASLRDWERTVGNYGYHEQAAMYLESLRVLRPLYAENGEPVERRFLWLVIETEAPYLARVFEADQDALDAGHAEFRKHLATYAACMKSGIWPGYDDGVEIAGLPPWMAKVWSAGL